MNFNFLNDNGVKQLIREKKFYPCKLNKNARYKVDQVYWNGYFQKYFKVLEINGDDVLVEWEDGRTSTEKTALDFQHDYALFPFEFDFEKKSSNILQSLRGGEYKALLFLGELSPKRANDLYQFYETAKFPPNDFFYYFLLSYKRDENGFTYGLKRDYSKSPKK